MHLPINAMLLKIAITASMSLMINVDAHSENEKTHSLKINQSKPNIVWLITEDNSKHYLKLYDDSGASMPTVEKMAENGLVFDNAFSNTPVCSIY